MKVHHTGYAVKNIEAARETFEALGYQFGGRTEDVLRNVSIMFGENEGNRIELISPISAGSPVDDILRKNGCVPYHICYEAEDLEREAERLQEMGFYMIRKPEPACALQGRRVIFFMSLSVGLIELVEGQEDGTHDQKAVCRMSGCGSPGKKNV